MKEGIKKNIYYELNTHNVLKEQKDNHTNYTFGRYRVSCFYDYIAIRKLNKNNGAFVYLKGADWSDDFPKNDVYAIYVAANNKANGKEYIDPYKNIPADVAIKDLTTKFCKEMKNSAGEFFPYDMPKYQCLRTLVEMKHMLEKTLKEYYAKQKS